MANATEFLMLDSSGQAIANTLKEKAKTAEYNVHPNLLKNWYFVNPVNQRGKTSYTGARYSVDNWYLRGANNMLTLLDEGVKLTLVNANAATALNQRIEFPNDLIGETVTISALIVDTSFSEESTGCRFEISRANSASVNSSPINGGIYFKVPGLYTKTFIVDTLNTYSGINFGFYFNNIYNRVNNYITVAAVKLELGEEQTLAHNEGTEENPVWVLNEIPDYESELLKCQRYFQVFSSTSARPSYGPDCRPTMQTATPTTGTISISGKTYYSLSSEL